jgi:hypothetical protein
MHVSRDELEPMVLGEYEGRKVDAGEVDEHDRTMATVDRNVGMVAS